MSHQDPEVIRLQAELRGTLDRMADALNSATHQLSLMPITFRADLLATARNDALEEAEKVVDSFSGQYQIMLRWQKHPTDYAQGYDDASSGIASAIRAFKTSDNRPTTS